MSETQKEEELMIKKLEKQENPLLFEIPTVEEQSYMTNAAERIVKSNFFGEKNIMAAEAKVNILVKTLKVDPYSFYKDIQIMEFGGTKVITQSAYLMSFLVLRSFPHAILNQGWGGKDMEYGFKMAVKRPGRKLTEPFKFTLQDALDANLIYEKNGLLYGRKNKNWEHYTDDMLRSRCISKMARTTFPDVLGGIIYTPEDFDEHVEASQ